MKKILYFIALIALCSAVQAKEVVVPKGTNIDISTKKVITSKRVPNTYEVKAIIKDDVIVDGVIVFCEHDPAIIEIGEVEKAKSFGRAGSLTIIGGSAVDANGQSHKFIFDREFTCKNDIWLTRWIPFNKGAQAVIYPSNKFVVQTNRDFIFKEEKSVQKVQQVTKNSNQNNNSNKNMNVQFGLINQNQNEYLF